MEFKTEGYVVAINMIIEGDVDDIITIVYLAEDPHDENEYENVWDDLDDATLFDTKKEAEIFVKRHEDKIFKNIQKLTDEFTIEIYKVKTTTTTKLVKSYPYDGE